MQDETLADRLDRMAFAQPTGSQSQSDLLAAATIWRKHVSRPASAPVADAPLTHRCANCGAVFQGAGCPSCRLAAPVASAPVTEDDEVERIRGRGPAYPYTPNTAPPTPLASAPVAGEAQPVIHQHGFAADNQRLRAINESLDKQLEEVMTERDEYHDMADKLANAIADHLLVEIGEHTSSNCPWMRALEAIENAPPQASAAAFAKLQSAYVGACDQIAELLAEKQASTENAPVTGEAFMYGIMGPDGKAHFEEFCVSGNRSELQTEVVDHLNRDNPEDGAYSVVALFRDAAPQASAEDVRMQRLTERDQEHVQAFIDCDGLGSMIVEGPRYSAIVRALKQPKAATQPEQGERDA
ncbi:hypothetical protein [Achromobacter xylosoxidans]|uniref:hypothetical protein n=1 Tax=Alcaligenes xylosoxydans xylosoxydans TaxID=85698 RepID=UPI001F55AB99|nr:hypothetical protein [Achromobacter xylosoxidans]